MEPRFTINFDLFVIFKSNQNSRFLNLVTNRLGSEWPLYEYGLTLLIGLFLEYYVIHSRDLL